MLSVRELEALKSTGIALLQPLPPGLVAEILWHFNDRPVFRDAHVPQTARNRGDMIPVPRSEAVDCEYVCAHTDDAILAPHLFEFGLRTIDLAATYLGRDPPVAYSMNAFWTRPGAQLRTDIQAFHRDADDEKFLAIFVYLSDVESEKDGAHLLEGPDGVIRPVLGPAGTAFAADTSLLHMGRKPETKERGIAWFRWGSSDRPPAGVWDKVEPISVATFGASRYPVSQRLRDAVKLLVTP